MRIATYNVNSVGARLSVLLHWLASSKPDVACLQELKTTDEKFPIDAIRGAGYEAVWHGQKAWNGVAILARGEKPQDLLLSPVLVPRLMAAGVDPDIRALEKTSDHAPTWVEVVS